MALVARPWYNAGSEVKKMSSKHASKVLSGMRCDIVRYLTHT